VSGSVVRIKICGLTRVEEALACLGAGADWIGLNFHPGSPRFVDQERAREIMAAVADPSRVVGVFVDRPAEQVAEIAGQLGLEIVQLHGREPPEDFLALARFQIVRAFRLGGSVDIKAMLDDLERARSLGRVPDAILIDAAVPGQAGGTGTPVAEILLDQLPPLPHLILAGGLHPGNVAARIARIRPWMVDVASGVECSPSRKDPTKVAAFIRAARSVLDDEMVDNPRAGG
jgi:phosphoribosylanthranilate isomerase